MKKLLNAILVFCFISAYPQTHAINLEKLGKLKEAAQSIVLLNNKTAVIPLTDLKDLKIASINFNFDDASMFDSIANKYWGTTDFDAGKIKDDSDFYALHDKLKFFNVIIILLSADKSFQPALPDFIKDEETNNIVLVVLEGSGNSLSYLDDIKSPIIWYKNNDPEGASVAAQLIFGGIAAANHLDSSYSKSFKKGNGFVTQKIRLGYSIPEAVALNSDIIQALDSLIYAGIAAHSAPTVVVLLAKDGKVVFHKAYGKHTYDGNEPTKPEDLFDLASVTKVSATTPAIMRLYDKKLISLDSPISEYVEATRDIPDKMDIKIKEALLHEAGYTPYIKFYEQLKPLDMSQDSSAAYPTKVADHYYLRANYFNEVMWPVTLHSKVETRGKFVYSDVSMYMMKEVVETVTHRKLNEYVLNDLYLPLGMQTTGFLPRNRFAKSRIVPTTENDNWFRNMLVQGYVNDPGSAMAGGVEGHAGLFANANDLAILFQMFLNKGVYGGQRFYQESTVSLFTSRESKTTNRGYGFDRISEKEQMDNRGYPSQQAFGHSGYTGTLVWVDPRYDMVFICLTNRVYPDDGKTYGPSKTNLRQLILDFFYKAIIK